jgi:hypothetical protein
MLDEELDPSLARMQIVHEIAQGIVRVYSYTCRRPLTVDFTIANICQMATLAG